MYCPESDFSQGRQQYFTSSLPSKFRFPLSTVRIPFCFKQKKTPIDQLAKKKTEARNSQNATHLRTHFTIFVYLFIMFISRHVKIAFSFWGRIIFSLQSVAEDLLHDRAAFY